MERYIWSLDISTTNIGFALWNDKGELIELKHLALKTDKKVIVEDRDIYKAEVFRNYVLEYKEYVQNKLNGKIINVVVEEPLGGSNNPTTSALLFGFNGICRYILYKIFDIKPLKISVYQSRKQFCPELVHTSKRKGKIVEILSFPVEYKNKKKLYIWKKVCNLEPQIEWFYKKGTTDDPRDMCFDMSDSYAVGFAGLKKLGIIK